MKSRFSKFPREARNSKPTPDSERSEKSKDSIFFLLPRRFWDFSWPFSESVQKTVHNGGIESLRRRVWAYFPEVSKNCSKLVTKQFVTKFSTSVQKRFVTNQGFDKAILYRVIRPSMCILFKQAFWLFRLKRHNSKHLLQRNWRSKSWRLYSKMCIFLVIG